MGCEKHKKLVEKYDGSLKELAEDIGNLHYEELQKFFEGLSRKLIKDSFADHQKNRNKLGDELAFAAGNIIAASKNIGKAWDISKPYMK